MFTAIGSYIGHTPFNDWFEPDTTERHPLGTVVDAVDPYWGAGEFIYVESDDTIVKGSVCMIDDSMKAKLVPNTAGQGFPVGIAMAPMTTGKFGWLQLRGLAVYKTGSTVAAGTAVGITAAGVVGTLANGKQLLGNRNMRSATATASFTNTQTFNGLGHLFRAAGYDGAFLGMALSGSGVPASTVVAGLDPDGKTIRMGSAIGTFDKLATASALVTVTGTYTGYGAGVINAPFAQGQVV